MGHLQVAGPRRHGQLQDGPPVVKHSATHPNTLLGCVENFNVDLFLLNIVFARVIYILQKLKNTTKRGSCQFVGGGGEVV